jgi:hypothetical protein
VRIRNGSWFKLSKVFNFFRYNVSYKRLAHNLFLLVMCQTFCACSTMEPITGKRIAHFVGAITEATVTDFINKNQKAELVPEILAITSLGGNVDAGIRLGQWILDNNIDVSIPSYCLSSCANYVFLAGKRKSIAPRAVVAWHGSIEQSDFVAKNDLFETTISRLKLNPNDLSAQEFLNQNRKWYEGFNRSRLLQRGLFQKLKINPRVMTIGQEIDGLKRGFWTMSKEAMEQFGIFGLDVANGYASDAYMANLQFRQHNIRVLKGEQIEKEILWNNDRIK